MSPEKGDHFKTKILCQLAFFTGIPISFREGQICKSSYGTPAALKKKHSTWWPVVALGCEPPPSKGGKEPLMTNRNPQPKLSENSGGCCEGGCSPKSCQPSTTPSTPLPCHHLLGKNMSICWTKNTLEKTPPVSSWWFQPILKI